jgi:Leu/Phe-tRNA-protein transferase
MKKFLILFLLAIGGTFSVEAQTQKGDQLLGGSLGVSTGSSTTDFVNNQYLSNNTSKTNNFSIGPSYSYFVANNLV